MYHLHLFSKNITWHLLLAIIVSQPVHSPAQEKKWTLETCIRQALKANVALNEAVASNEVNKINYDQSRSNQLPNVNMSGGYSYDHGRDLNPVTYQYVNQDVNAASLELNTSITLFNGLKYINLIRENRLNYEAGNLDIEKMRNDLMLNVIAAYMQVLFEYEAVEIAAAQVSVTGEHLQYTAKYVRAGGMPESSLLQIQAQLAADSAAVVDAQNQLQLAKVTLMQYMEMPVENTFEIERPATDGLDIDIVPSPQDICNKAMGFLPEIKSADMKIRSAQSGLKVARSEILPRLTLGGSLGTSYSSANSLISYRTTSDVGTIGYISGNPTEVVYGPVYKTTTVSAPYSFSRQFGDNFAQGITLNLSVPIFNNMLYRSDIKRSVVNVKIARLNQDLIKNQVRKSIEVAYTDQSAAAKNYTATKKQLAYEERSYRDIGIRFNAGTSNATDLYVEKGIYVKAQLAHLQAKYEYMFKKKVVDFYTGDLIIK